jgi:hypothetical protein
MTETLSGSARDLFLTIAHCPVIVKLRADTTSPSPCRTIVELQFGRPAERHIAEPWTGHLDRAPILFVASNPGWDDSDQGVWAADDASLIDIFVNYFGEDSRYSVGGIRAIGPDGRPEARWVRYWAYARQRAIELLGEDVVPGESYALTEVVHCNSRKETEGATWDALRECVPRYLPRVIRLSAASIIVVVGAIAAHAFRTCAISGEGRVIGPLEVEGRERVVVFMPHPNSRGGSKSFAGNVPEHLAWLQERARAAGRPR